LPGQDPVGPAGRVVVERVNLYAGSAAAVVDANRTSVVLLKASFDPGWTATVDGESVTPEMIAPALVGVTVAPGIHRVVFTYRGYGSYPLLFGTALATLVAVGVGPTLWRRRRQLLARRQPLDDGIPAG
jgi:uncharacterized membrane protein YfhO